MKICKPEIDWATSNYNSLCTPSCREEVRWSSMIVKWNEDGDNESTNVWLPDIGGSTMEINLILEIMADSAGSRKEGGQDGPTPAIN